MLKQASCTLALAALLGGCASQPPSDEWTRWVCDSQAEVLWRLAGADGESVDLRLGGDDIVHRLVQEPSGSGVLAFHTKGEEGLVYRVADDDLIGRGCRAR